MIRTQKTRIPKGAKLRVLVVDDSAVVRSLVTHALNEVPGMEVVGTASNGAIALQKIAHLKPDAITLDLEMPEMDGLQALRHIRAQYPQMCVIMLSSVTERGARATMDALAAGANDYVAKGSTAGSAEASVVALRAELAPRIRQFFDFGEGQPGPAPSGPTQFRSVRPAAKVRRQAVVIGISTGGPTALAKIAPQFPKNFRLPVLLVQHMPTMFTRLLAERLDSLSSLTVREAQDGMPIVPGQILLAPGDFHMSVGRKGNDAVVKLDQNPPENSCRPAADVLFRSASAAWGAGCVAAVLTGMGHDGRRGCEQLKAAGAYVIAQDAATSVVWGMPGSVVEAGLADAILPLEEIVPEIVRQALQ